MCFGVAPGHAVWVPFGHIPVIIGVGPRSSKSTVQKQTYSVMQYVQIPLMDTFAYFKVSIPIRVEIVAGLTKPSLVTFPS